MLPTVRRAIHRGKGFDESLLESSFQSSVASFQTGYWELFTGDWILYLS